METVYSFPNGFAKEAAATYLWLRHYNLNPKWGVHPGYCEILLTNDEAKCLREMQLLNPARFGNPKPKE